MPHMQRATVGSSGFLPFNKKKSYAWHRLEQVKAINSLSEVLAISNFFNPLNASYYKLFWNLKSSAPKSSTFLFWFYESYKIGYANRSPWKSILTS